MKTAFLTFDQTGHRDSASSRIRAEWVMKHMPEAEFYRYGHSYDAMVFDKVFNPEFCRLFKGIKVLDVCDPVWFEGGVRLTETLRECDAVTCPTEALASVLRQMTDKPVQVIPDRHDKAYFKEYRHWHEGPIGKAVWYGYSDHSHALDLLRTELKRRKIEVTIVSDRPLTVPGVKTRFVRWNRDTVNAEIVKADVALCPPGLSPAFAYKSNNRTVNAWFLGVPVVSRASDFERLDDWRTRVEEAEANLKVACENWTSDISAKELTELIESL